MCGISGILSLKACLGNIDDRAKLAGEILDSLEHRGPDGSGQWWDAESRVALFHTRLSILDLSTNGHQPMHSHDGRFVLTYNGELYNHVEIRKNLTNKGIKFNGSSDTEVFLEAFALWGLSDTLKMANGMFALALYDTKTRRLFLARDRMGEKPLYYGQYKNRIFFSSELKTFHHWPNFKCEIDDTALSLYFRYGYVPAPHSIYKHVQKLPAGSYVEFSDSREPRRKPEKYWVNPGHTNETERQVEPKRDYLEALESCLQGAVSIRMRSDVGMGTFLSSGIDSSLITALVQAQSARRYNSYTIGFENPMYDEAPEASKIAKHIGTDHTELFMSTKQLVDSVQKLPTVYCEPFSDESQLPTLLVSELARTKVKSIISGDGGDEVFGGYNRYLAAETIWKKLNKLPIVFRRLISFSLSRKSQWWNNFLLRLAAGKISTIQLKKLAYSFQANNIVELYDNFIRRDHGLSAVQPGLRCTTLPSIKKYAHRAVSDVLMANDQEIYLPDDILVKLDRASMATGLETRAPFLDHHVVEFGWSLPNSSKIDGGTGKVLLRQLLHKYVPEELLSANKKGFSPPVASWLRDDLHDWARELIDYSQNTREYINVNRLEEIWKIHLSETADYSRQLWTILMFLAWHQKWHR